MWLHQKVLNCSKSSIESMLDYLVSPQSGMDSSLHVLAHLGRKKLWIGFLPQTGPILPNKDCSSGRFLLLVAERFLDPFHLPSLVWIISSAGLLSKPAYPILLGLRCEDLLPVCFFLHAYFMFNKFEIKSKLSLWGIFLFYQHSSWQQVILAFLKLCYLTSQKFTDFSKFQRPQQQLGQDDLLK